jgi:glycosyltransferase involved in cell wall biosynthesis
MSGERHGMDTVRAEAKLTEPGGPSAGADRLSVCIVAHAAFGALTGGTRGHIGGVERQTSFMARWLAAHGHRVSLVTWDEGQADGVEIDGVRVLTVCRRDAGLPGFRFVHPRWTGLTRALRRADADAYYHNGAEYVTGQVALTARSLGRAFVFSSAADADCDIRMPHVSTLRERTLYRFGLRSAHRLIVQTRAQQERLRAGFGIDSVPIPMPCPAPAGFSPRTPPTLATSRVLWLGRVCEVKRPDRLLEVARLCPELSFDLVGPGDGGAYAARLMSAARGVPNVTVHGPVERAGVTALYRQAACLFLTSDSEGFPNTFLEAWSQGLPVISTIDPDGLISSRGLGDTAADSPGLARAIRDLLGSPERWRQASRSARRYYEEHHAPEVVMPRFVQVFSEAVVAVRSRSHTGHFAAASFGK